MSGNTGVTTSDVIMLSFLQIQHVGLQEKSFNSSIKQHKCKTFIKGRMFSQIQPRGPYRPRPNSHILS